MFLYEALLLSVLGVLRVLASVASNPRFSRFVAMRGAEETARARARLEEALAGLDAGARIAWVHVASVGEMEQAIPVARALHEAAGVRFFLTYFSPSTEPYLKNFPATVATAPLPIDVRSRHRSLLAALRAHARCEHLILVRYDLWPGLLSEASHSGLRVSLLAATARKARGGLAGLASRAAARFLLRRVSTVFTVSSDDLAYFSRVAPRARVLHAGDPKWVRAKERADRLRTAGLAPSLTPLSALARAFQARGGKVFVFGSPHAEEHEVALACAALPGTLVIYVPHDPSEAALASLEDSCRARHLEWVLLSSLAPSEGFRARPGASHVPPRLYTPHPFDNDPRHHDAPEAILPEPSPTRGEPTRPRLVIVDRTGVLAETYSLADAAVVGGGFDGQIHNTLEPAAHPVPVLLGDRLSRSPEAEALVEAGAARAFRTTEALFQFLDGCVRVGLAPDGEGTPPSPGAILVGLRLKALDLFKSIPSTSEVVSAALFESLAFPSSPSPARIPADPG